MNAGGSGFPDDDFSGLDAYVDGRLPASERAAFEARLADDPTLLAGVELQRRLDTALRSLFAVPAFPGVPSNGHPAPVPRGQAAGPRWVQWIRRDVLIGSLFAAIGITAAVVTWFSEFAPARTQVTFEMAYRQNIESGEVGGCGIADASEMESISQLSVGSALRLRTAPRDVELLGLSHVDVLSTQTLVLRAKVEGREVLVFADRVSNDSPSSAAKCAKSGIHMYRRQIGDVVLYEMSPLDKPRLLDLYEPVSAGHPVSTAPAESVH